MTLRQIINRLDPFTRTHRPRSASFWMLPWRVLTIQDIMAREG